MIKTKVSVKKKIQNTDKDNFGFRQLTFSNADRTVSGM